jgi:hypothetical protein
MNGALNARRRQSLYTLAGAVLGAAFGIIPVVLSNGVLEPQNWVAAMFEILVGALGGYLLDKAKTTQELAEKQEEALDRSCNLLHQFRDLHSFARHLHDLLALRPQLMSPILKRLLDDLPRISCRNRSELEYLLAELVKATTVSWDCLHQNSITLLVSNQHNAARSAYLNALQSKAESITLRRILILSKEHQEELNRDDHRELYLAGAGRGFESYWADEDQVRVFLDDPTFHLDDCALMDGCLMMRAQAESRKQTAVLKGNGENRDEPYLATLAYVGPVETASIPAAWLPSNHQDDPFWKVKRLFDELELWRQHRHRPGRVGLQFHEIHSIAATEVAA